MVFILIDYNCA